ncbi:MAG TPA: thymidine kinase [Bacilli bacterium]|jgi:thymidine kinase|nr:thymidine kinase [Bacilli bacterium]MDD3389180.1 thymidine kinase [Bacilli bacterium]MDD4344979.1 thymidine kinase [Bacilli bacterium]MDD4521156.1 thymidine kinase [Bacilli bacterium]MDY0399923.1 thymidine kinase [Bacilli bacterium]
MKKLGRIEVITGPMFAGKTEELIRRVRRAEFAKENIVVFKPLIDDRYAQNEVVSHNNSRTRSVNIRAAKEIFEYIDEKTNIIAIDEVQFLDDEVVSISEQLANRGMRVIVSGLDQNFRGEPFSFMPDLLALADEVLKLTAVCVICHAPATKTQRLVNHEPANFNDPLIVVGASDSYEARCRHCHEVPGRPNDFLKKKQD